VEDNTNVLKVYIAGVQFNMEYLF